MMRGPSQQLEHAAKVLKGRPDREPSKSHPMTSEWARDYAINLVTTVPPERWRAEIAKRVPDQRAAIVAELETLIGDLAVIRRIAAAPEN